MKKFSEIHQGVLNHIFNKLSTLNTIENQIHPHLPVELRGYCRVANFENNILTFALKNSLWATQFKFSIPQLIKSFRTNAGLPALVSISYYIEPEFERLFGST
jgi:hypothetical protein